MEEVKKDRDLGNYKASFSNWKAKIAKEGIKDISKTNADLVIQFLSDMELGQNIARRSKRGGRGKHRLMVLKNKLLQLIRILEKEGVLNITKIKEEKLHSITQKIFKGDIKRVDGKNYRCPAEFVGSFKTFWHWWMKISKKKGKSVLDITEDLETTAPENQFVYLTKEDVDKLAKHKKFDYNEKVMIKFMFDSFMRFPSEVLNLKVKDIYKDKQDYVCVNVSSEVGTKTKSSIRNFNLLYCGDEILRYIETNKLQGDDFLFKFMKNYNYVGAFNKKLKEIAVEIFGDKVSHPVAGESYSRISGYDLRHAGAIHFRLLASKNGNISLDVIRQRGGWSDFDMLNYYTKFLGLDGKIDKDMTLVAEDKTRIEKELNSEIEKRKAMEARLKNTEASVSEMMAMMSKDKRYKLVANPDRENLVEIERDISKGDKEFEKSLVGLKFKKVIKKT